MPNPAQVIDVEEAAFDRDVVQRSHDVPVVVDFWAGWCQPCRVLGPALEEAVEDRDGAVVLAKVDVDRNPGLAQRFGVQGIPAVKGFRDGTVVDEFTGAAGRSQIESFLDRLVPTEADRLAARGQELAASDPDGAARAFEQALEVDPGHRDAAIGLAELVAGDDPDRALELLRPHRPFPAAETVATRAELARAGGLDTAALRRRVGDDPHDHEARLLLGRALAAEDDYAGAVEHLLAAVRAGGEVREAAREQLVALFGMLGDDHELTRDARRRLASALY